MFLFLLKNFKKLSNQDVIHLHDTWTFMWLLPIIPLLKKPIFMSFCGYEGYPIRMFYKLQRKFAEKVVKGNICIGPYIPKWYGTKPDYIMVGGVEVPRDIPRNHFEESAVFIGRLAEDTNILEFLECLSILKDVHGIELPLHICGDGPLRSKIKEYAQQNNLRIIMHGWVKDPQSYLIRCHYVFVSSVLSILEAMVYNRPVFTLYNNPLKKDYIYTIGGEDVMFIADSPKKLAEKLYSAIKNPEIIRPVLEQAYSFAIEQNYENMANIYLKLYHKGNVSFN
jgi:glycosyltransferase involved in cell wall biosynthesis